MLVTALIVGTENGVLFCIVLLLLLAAAVGLVVAIIEED
jgi:hypothetical protein